MSNPAKRMDQLDELHMHVTQAERREKFHAKEVSSILLGHGGDAHQWLVLTHLDCKAFWIGLSES